MPALSQNIGTTIAFLRKRVGLTQRALAERLGVTDKAVSRWERGAGIPDQSLLAALAEALNVDIETILAGRYANIAEDWLGVVALEYPAGMGPETLLFDRPALELQIGYLLLSGIRDVVLMGTDERLAAARRVVAGLPELGVEILFVDCVFGQAGALPAKGRGGRGVMFVDGLDFLYGKDLTRAFWRQISESDVPARLASHSGVPLHVGFLPAAAGVSAAAGEGADDTVMEVSARVAGFADAKLKKLERGIVAFPIASALDALDAANMIAILMRQQGEPFMDLEAVVAARSARA